MPNINDLVASLQPQPPESLWRKIVMTTLRAWGVCMLVIAAFLTVVLAFRGGWRLVSWLVDPMSGPYMR